MALKEFGSAPSAAGVTLTRYRVRRALRSLEALLATSSQRSALASANEPPLERASRTRFEAREVAFVPELVAAIETLVWCIRRLEDPSDVRCYVKALVSVLEAILEVTSRLVGP
jgi:hypothetical protein